MNFQYLQDMFESLGLPQTSFEGLTQHTSGDIATALATTYGIDESLLPASLFTSLTPDLLKGTYGKTYSPIIQSKQPALLDALTKTVEGKTGQSAHGGFASSGGWQDYKKGAFDVYGKHMTDVLTGIGTSRSESFQNIFDLINSWKATAQDIRYGNTSVT